MQPSTLPSVKIPSSEARSLASQSVPASALSGSRKAGRLGQTISIAIIVLASLAGALVWPLSDFGRAAPLSASRGWITSLVAAWLLLTAWGLLFAILLRRARAMSVERALYLSALCHIPLYLCIALPATLYGSDLANHIYLDAPYGRTIFQPAAKTYTLLGPATAQSLSILLLNWRVVARAMPIASVTVVALALRLWNLNWGLPALTHGDEHHYLGKAMVMLGTGNFDPDYFQNPSLLIYLDYFVDRLLSPHVQDFHLIASFFGWQILDPRGDYLMDIGARSISAIAGALTPLAVYLAAMELFRDRRPAIFGAAVMAVPLLHVRDSHFATNDVLCTFLLSLSFLFASRIYRRGGLANYILAGLMGGLATTTKYNAGFFCVGILVAHCLSERQAAKQETLLRRHAPLLISGLAAMAAYLVGTPYTILNFPRFWYDFRTQLGFGARLWGGQDDLPTPLLYLYALQQGFGVLPLVLAILAIPILFGQGWRRFAVVMSIPTIYLAFMFGQRLFFARFAMPVLPFLSLLAGFTLWKASTRVNRPLLRRALSGVLLTATLAQPLAFSWQHVILIGRDDTRATAAAWIESNVPRGATIGAEIRTGLHTPFAWKGTGAPMPGTSIIHPEDPEDIQEVTSGRFDYLITGSWGYDEWLQRANSPLEQHPLFGYLERVGKPVLIVRPGENGTDLPYSFEDTMTPFWHLFDRERPGPTVVVYQLPRQR